MQPGPIDVPDGELDGGVLTVEAVQFDRRDGQVAQKAVVAPAREQGLLGDIDQTGAPHDQAVAFVVDFGDLGDAVGGVGDSFPSALVDGGDGGGDGTVATTHGHGVAHVQAAEHGDGGMGPKA